MNPQEEQKSNCCKSLVAITGSDEGTYCYVCRLCHKPCDTISNIVASEVPSSWEVEFNKRFPVAIKGWIYEKYRGIFNEESEYFGAIRDFIHKVEAAAEKRGYERGKLEQIEHCDEPECPECYNAAYQRGKKEFEKIIRMRLKYCQEQNGRDDCKNCGLCEEDLIQDSI